MERRGDTELQTTRADLCRHAQLFAVAAPCQRHDTLCARVPTQHTLGPTPAGVRVDLAELEAALSRHPSVAVAAAKLWQLAAGPALAAYVQLAEQQPSSSGGSARRQAAPSSSELQRWCQQRLPPAAVPQHVLMLPQLPRSVAGKVQRSQLPHPLEPAGAGPAAAVAGGASSGAADAAAPPSKRPRGSEAPAAAARPAAPAISELTVSRAFAAALGHSEFEATSNLFSIGGNSLMAAQIAGEVAGGNMEAVFRFPTVRSLAAYLAGGPAAADAATAPGDGSGTGEQQHGGAQPAAFAVRQLDVSGGPQQQEGQCPGGLRLRLAWRARMLQCVDAAPVFEGAPAGEQQLGHRVFACSHGGDVCCYDSSSGKQLWVAQLPDRTDAGLAVCSGSSGSSGGSSSQPQQQEGEEQPQEQQQRFVAVATNGGTLAFLRGADGSLAGSLECGGGIRAPPVCDPWCSLVWQPTHGRTLVVAAALGREVTRLPLPAAASAAVAFDAERHLAFVSCLDGSLLAVAVNPQLLAAAARSGGSSSSSLAVAWRHQAAAPLFAPVAVLPSGRVVAAAVDGSLSCLGSSSGSEVWRAGVQGAVFAPLLLLPAAGGGGGGALLVGTQTGHLAAVDASSGRELSLLRLGAKVVGVQQLPPQPIAAAAATAGAGGAAQHACATMAVTLATGVVTVIDVARMLQGSGASSGGDSAAAPSSYVLDAVQLPADVFAAPAVGGGPGSGGALIGVGCRDDHLYCLSWSEQS